MFVIRKVAMKSENWASYSIKYQYIHIFTPITNEFPVSYLKDEPMQGDQVIKIPILDAPLVSHFIENELPSVLKFISLSNTVCCAHNSLLVIVISAFTGIK